MLIKMTTFEAMLGSVKVGEFAFERKQVAPNFTCKYQIKSNLLMQNQDSIKALKQLYKSTKLNTSSVQKIPIQNQTC